MSSSWDPRSEATPQHCEAELMAVVLEGRHGNHAADVAEFFASLHRLQGDAGRSQAWAGVAALVRTRERERLLEV